MCRRSATDRPSWGIDNAVDESGAGVAYSKMLRRKGHDWWFDAIMQAALPALHFDS